MEEIGSGYRPGPADSSVLYLQDEHRSRDIWDGNDVEPLTCRTRQSYGMKSFAPHQRMIPYLQSAGFFHVHRLGVGFKMDWGLVTALVERWRQETHSFHLTVGEATITLQDVAILMGLRIDGPPVTGTADYRWPSLCRKYLGLRPTRDVLKGSSLRITWLRQHFSNLPDNATEDIVQMHVRAYILCLLGGHLLPDKSGNTVQLIYLPLLSDLSHCGTLSWGSAVLACLYRALCRACQRGAREISGPLILLQLWSWERLHVGRPMRIGVAQMDPNTDPLGRRWRVKLSFAKNPAPHSVRYYRDELDKQTEDQVICQPYTLQVIHQLPAICLEGQHIWLAEVPLICFDMVEWHLPSRVMRQFGLVQPIPRNFDTEVQLHHQDKRGKPTFDWEEERLDYIRMWRRRLRTIVNGEPGPSHLPIDGEYMTWYRRITRQIISSLEDRPPMVFQPLGVTQHAMLERVGRICDMIHPETSSLSREAIQSIFAEANQLKHMILNIRLTEEQEPRDAGAPAGEEARKADDVATNLGIQQANGPTDQGEQVLNGMPSQHSTQPMIVYHRRRKRGQEHGHSHRGSDEAMAMASNQNPTTHDGEVPNQPPNQRTKNY